MKVGRRAVPVVSDSTPEPVPAGTRIALDPGTTTQPDGALVGGSPTRVMRLTEPGREAMRELASGPARSDRARRLARRLTDAGIAHPRPEPGIAAAVTVIIPVRDRGDDLDRCLTALGDQHPVVVVDDQSRDHAAIAAVAHRYGAKVLRRNNNGGPAAARNTALEVVDTEFIALLDSDCTPSPGWIDSLIGHLADPAVAAVAPRILPAAIDTSAQRYAAARGSLDLGLKEARVIPLSPVAYVPTAALVVRRSALLEVARDGKVFDESMRYGEDVDLIWRLHESGWRIRYAPSVTVHHREPAGWVALLRRRFNYGTSAAPLARRHQGFMTPLVVHPLPVATIAAAWVGRPRAAAAGFTAGAALTRRTLRAVGVERPQPVATNAKLLAATWIGLSRYLTQFAGPAVVAAAATPGPRSRRRRLIAAAILLTPAADAWRTRRAAMHPVAFIAANVADQVAYGAGVWTSVVRDRTAALLLPTIV